MTVHFRRRRLSRIDELGALSMSVLVGLGGAAVAYYVTRVLLSRERLGGEPPTPVAAAAGPSELPSPRRSMPRSGGDPSGSEG